MPKGRKNLVLIILLLIFLICLYVDIFVGYKNSGVNLIFKAFHSKTFLLTNDPDSIILKVLRFPRALKAIIAGASLALAGLFMQSVSKNPLAEPYITGISSGAGLGIVLSIVLFNSSNYSLFGFLGALLSSFLVISFAGLNKFSITKLVLVGLSLNVFVSSLISLIVLACPDKSYTMMLILSGGFNNSDVISNKSLLVLFILILTVCCFLIPKFNFLRLDDNLVISSKKKRNLYIILIIIASSFLASLSVFAAGILGFIGIIAPQTSRMIVGQDFRYLFPANILLGSSFVLLSDFISRTAIYPLQLPLGLVIAFIGAPVFVFFLTKRGNIFNDRN